MADLHEDDDNDHFHDVPVSVSPQYNHLPHHLDQFDVFPLDVDLSSSQDSLHRRTRRIDHIPPSVSSLDRENQVNSVTDMFHQRGQQSRWQSQPHAPSCSIDETCLFNSDRSFRVIEENDDYISNEFEAYLGPGSGLGLEFLFGHSENPNFDDDNNPGFIIADSTNSSQLGELRLTDIEADDEDASFPFWCDVFPLEDEIPNPNANSNSNSNANANEDFEWEELDDDDDDDALVSPVLLTAFEEPNEEEPDAVEWQVLSNVHNFDPNPDSEDQYEDYSYTEYGMFFGQFADGDAPYSGRPPASKTAVANLSTVVVNQEDVVKNNIVCAVCKDEVVVGELVTRLPCDHSYHGDCILPWLAVTNTCPVCRHELPTDDLDYERRKVERGGNA